MRLVAFVVTAGLVVAGIAPGQNPRAHAQQATIQAPKAPIGVIPGAAAGSPTQSPDTSNFDYASLFHDLVPDDTTGFRQIFDGRTLTGWDGDPRFWRVENGAIDMDFANLVTGNIHDERGRDVIVPRGYAIRITDGPVFHLIGRLADPVDIRGLMNVDNWNTYHIIARGPMIMEFLNGRLTAVVDDEDTKNRVLEGLLGLQMHVGPPFKVEFKNIWYKAL